MITHTKTCKCGFRMEVFERKDERAVGGVSLELAWELGCFTAKEAFHSFLCPDCGQRVLVQDLERGNS